MQEMQIFNNPEFGEIRTIMIDNEPWFVSVDVSNALGYTKTVNMTKLVDKEDRQNISSSILKEQGYRQAYTLGVINESGLYAAIFGSTLENAKKFKHWVTSEVLPQIRKAGSYVMPQVCNPSEIPLGELASYLKVLDRVAHRQNLAPHKIAENFKKVSAQFGVELTEDFVKVPEFEQLTIESIGKGD
mgnify:CR=1 FL=1